MGLDRQNRFDTPRRPARKRSGSLRQLPQRVLGSVRVRWRSAQCFTITRPARASPTSGLKRDVARTSCPSTVMSTSIPDTSADSIQAGSKGSTTDAREGLAGYCLNSELNSAPPPPRPTLTGVRSLCPAVASASASNPASPCSLPAESISSTASSASCRFSASGWRGRRSSALSGWPTLVKPGTRQEITISDFSRISSPTSHSIAR